MSHMSSGFYRDRLGFDPNKESNNTAGQQASAQVAMSASSMSRRTVTSASAAYSSSSLSRQETQQTSSRHVQSSSSDRQSAAGHYAVSSHVSNGNLVVDNGNGVIQAQSGNHYEENLGKIKDERDAIQKKTFTKWVNKHLKKAGRNVRDLFEDLRDGHNLLSLLEVLSGEVLPRERGRMRFHAIQNVETALRFLRYKEIKLVNIRGEDIVDGNPKLTLGLIWTIILHFQVGNSSLGVIQ